MHECFKCWEMQCSGKCGCHEEKAIEKDSNPLREYSLPALKEEIARRERQIAFAKEARRQERIEELHTIIDEARAELADLEFKIPEK